MSTETAGQTATRVIAATTIDPTQDRLFTKAKKSDHAESRTVSCSCESCPLLAARQCVVVTIFGHCPYGRYRVETGPTGRSGKMREWLAEKKKEHEGVGWLGYPPERLAFIGDYVYLPYTHMDMCKSVMFQRHSSAFVPGIRFIPRESWTLETVLTLIDFKPQNWGGYVITDYGLKSVPLFIQHIREQDAEMWMALIAARPELDVAPNYVGRKALVRTLAAGITIPPKDARYPVSWKWDGETLTTTDRNAYEDTWGGIKPASLELRLKPSDDAGVVVRDNAWVTPETVFVD